MRNQGVHFDLQSVPTRKDETEPASHYSLERARALLQSMHRSHTSGSSYYDRSLLEDPKEIPVRPVAPNEYSQVDPESMIPSEGGPTMTLGDFLGSDPSAYERELSYNRPATPEGYNPDTDGVSRTWSGGSHNFRPSPSNTQTRRDGLQDPNIQWEDLFPSGFYENDNAHPSNDNRTREEIERNLWHPLNTTRSMPFNLLASTI